MDKKVVIIFIFILSGLCGFAVSLYVHANHPASDVQLIETYHYPATFVKQLKGDPHAGEKIFKEFCSACHASQPKIDIHAPRINNKVVWHALGQLGLPALVKITATGVGAMPARGGCFECSDEQLSEAVEYILKTSH